ncbi:MAG TPA: proton-conducting transporter membrane subunit, partial [Methanoregula sp.]|nr:proton-conducting transporter membrane subunit [Methanoregula sp.]
MITTAPGTLVPLYIALGGIVLYVVISRIPPGYRRWGGTLTALWLTAAFLYLLFILIEYQSPLVVSYLGLTCGLLVTGLGGLAAFASQGNLNPGGPVRFYYPLCLFALAGATAVGFATDLFTIFVMVELSAIPVYALVAYRYHEDKNAVPAAMKYLVQGVSGTLTALLGVSILFLAGKTTDLASLPAALSGTSPVVILLAAALILLGYGVKLAIVPLHTWLPDAYALAPPGVTAIMVGATKTGVLVALFLSLTALPSDSSAIYLLGIIVTFLALITMTAGNLLALNQNDLRYILAYSSVAQMGYILLGFGMGLVYDFPFAFTAGLYYAIAYSIMKGGAFMAADAFAGEVGTADVGRMKGLGARHPLLGIAFVIFVLGLIGVPFTCGFLGKLLLEQAGMATSLMSGVVLALILAVNSVVSLGYYIPVLSTLMFSAPSADPVAGSTRKKAVLSRSVL